MSVSMVFYYRLLQEKLTLGCFWCVEGFGGLKVLECVNRMD
jgi:hypothetical protein